ncbi:MAG TPA: SurA N-terminal domain-containing protein [Pyrinomonadaceae bacterium]
MRNIAAPALVAAFALAIAACGGKGAAGGKDVAATVDGKEITLAEVDRIVNQQAQGQQLNTLQQAAARLQVLDKLIERRVLYARAEKEKTVPNDDEVTTFVNQQKQRLTAEEWEKSLKESNFTEEQVREEARKDIAIRKLQEKLYGRITIRDQEITDFYNANRAQFVNPRGVYLADIVVDPADSGGAYRDDAKSDAEATAKIQRLYATLKGGADFADVARASSEDPSGVRGGDIGMANEQLLQQNGFPGDLVGRFFNQMPVGSYTEPIRFGDGRWYIFKLTNRQLENRPLALEDAGVKDQIKQALIDQRQTVLNEALIRNAMSDVTVVNKLAESMLGDPNMLGGNQSVAPGASASPAASPSASPAGPAATPAAGPAASPAASPAAGASPAATPAARPATAASPAGSPKR